MELYTRDRNFVKQDEIDTFESAIWTERYAGDGDFQLDVPANSNMMAKLPKGQIMTCAGSEEPMILEHREIEEGLLKTTGITLTQWLNNRIIRASPDHKIREWAITGQPEAIINTLVANMCVTGSPFLDGTFDIGILVAQTAQFAIPGLEIPAGLVYTSDSISVSIPYGPLYNALKEIADTYEVGMKMILEDPGPDYLLNFFAYSGSDRTSDQSDFPVVKFSQSMDSFTNIKDLESLSEHKNYVYVFAPGADPAIVTGPGFSFVGGTEPGFDLRVLQEFADDIAPEIDTAPELIDALNYKARVEKFNHKVVQLVDGQIVEVEGVKYGTDFFLGDVVEVEGNTGVLQKARITEYIRSQDSAGEKAYPTLAMIDE